MDQFSPFVPASVRVLALPVGSIKRTNFHDALEQLRRTASTIRLGDVAPFVDDVDLTPSPKSFQHGCLFYNYVTTPPSDEHRDLSPYELFREPLLVIGLTNGLQTGEKTDQEKARKCMETLRERHPRVVDRQLLVLHARDCQDSGMKGVTFLHDPDVDYRASIHSAVCKISARLLGELATYTLALQASPSIQTPGRAVRKVHRPGSLQEFERRSASAHSTSGQTVAEPTTPTNERAIPSLSDATSPPPTSFDQVPHKSRASMVLSRSNSPTHGNLKHAARASSQDGVAAQGFGASSQEKLKARGKMRVGIVIGSIWLMAGQWAEALKILSEHIPKARSLGDTLWQAKGLDLLVICQLLHAWAGIEFAIPTICYPLLDRMITGHSQRLSINLPSDFRDAEAAQKATLHKLSNLLPDLANLTVSLYRSCEGSLELPRICTSASAVRTARLLLMLQQNDALSQASLDKFFRQPPSQEHHSLSSSFGRQISRQTIINILFQAHPTADDELAVADRVAILAGIASMCASMRLPRKKAAVMRELILNLTSGLEQAKKRGAAEIGIHPAAISLATIGSDTMSAAAKSSEGLQQMLSEVAAAYGVPSTDPSVWGADRTLATSFGGNAMKAAVLTELSAFCEASSDLNGILKLSSTALRMSGPHGAANFEATHNAASLPRREQVRLTSAIGRTVGISRHLQLSEAEATYWDPYIIRGISFASPDASRQVIELAALKAIESDTKSSNPLLYDPHAANKTHAARLTQKPHVLISKEKVECAVTLQNPFDVAVEVESLRLITEGVVLETSNATMNLEPLRLQKMPLQVTPHGAGDCQIKSCRVKISGCVLQDFPIVEKPWAPTPSLLVKAIGQEGKFDEASSLSIDAPAEPELKTVRITVLEALPLLQLGAVSELDGSLMLLEGEHRDVRLKLENDTDITAAVFKIVSSSDAVGLQRDIDEANPFVVPAKASTDLQFRIVGRVGLSHVRLSLDYKAEGAGATHARTLNTSLEVTLNAALHVRHVDIHSSEDDLESCLLSLDLRNAWTRTLSYHCSVFTSSEAQSGVLTSNQTDRVFLRIPRSVDHGEGEKNLIAAILGSFAVRWSCHDREGDLNTSQFSLSSGALGRAQRAPVDIGLDLVDSDGAGLDSIPAGSFAIIRAQVRPQGIALTSGPLVAHLRQLPTGALPTLDSRVVIPGVSHKVLRSMKGPEEEIRLEFPLCALSTGPLEMELSVRPADMWKGHKTDRWSVRRSLSVTVA